MRPREGARASYAKTEKQVIETLSITTLCKEPRRRRLKMEEDSLIPSTRAGVCNANKQRKRNPRLESDNSGGRCGNKVGVLIGSS